MTIARGGSYGALKSTTAWVVGVVVLVLICMA
jgi:hypothetical protein